ncbi:MAG: class I SAM-dependent methyltransferase [Bdellovibrionales bacterium]|nr:class I SAM-dependent methyltransferase [Bdellovibrionales bacterium]
MKQILNLVLTRLSKNDECVRLFHGRGKKVPGLEHLSIDFFPPHILITTYKEIGESEKTELKDLLLSLKIPDLQSIILQKRYIKGESTEALFGEIPIDHFAVENSEKYLINLKNPQNIGFFLDMKVGRDLLRVNSAEKMVLNLFSYTCSLSVAALKGGAIEVVNVDMSKAALKVGEKNHLLNGLVKKSKFVPYDIMKSFGNITRKGPYDIVIIDPPTYQGDSFKVERDYHKIVKRLADMTNPGAMILACLNAPHLGSDFIKNIFKEHAMGFSYEETFYSSFSELDSNPEEGLKILIYKKNN